MSDYEYKTVLTFWFEELSPQDWFSANSEVDDKIKHRFGEFLLAAKKGELYNWRKSMQGRLAEIIVLDQFSRNIYRNDSRAFEGDLAALVLAQEAVKLEEKAVLTTLERSFLYMPFMHSESRYIQEQYAMVYFKEPGLEKRYRYAKEHYETIKKFGRFPYRNHALGRRSTPEEKAYLKENNE
ncbi:membrane protein [Enterococcus saigonensis]|uniref:Membrane protein n=1 Tax=Enterococcus saigonensis TaxID=1805431 RepID=A0A679ITQ8_9ENTE|nr:DUF924 family protein [Enterococcus saigonensis]BCA87027.1 membrane protein [Enterococcus saigonensis]